MLSAALVALAGAQAFLAVLALRRRDLLVAAVGAGVAYDSAVIGLGALVGEGEVLTALSVGRFVGHALLTPLLAVWALSRRPAAWGLAALLAAYGLALDVAALRLEPRHYADTLRLAPVESGPPVPALVVIVVLGVVAWRTRRWPLLAATGVMVVMSGAAVAVPPLGNLGEAVLLAAVVAQLRAGRDAAPAERGTAHRPPPG